MKKGIWIIVIIIILIGAVVIFSTKEKNVTIDITKLADDIMQNIKFEDEMNKANNNTIEKLYNINNEINQVVYMSSGATAEEIAIFEFADKEECKEAIEKANKRIEEQKQSFKAYMPKEMKKLEEAIINTKENYLMIFITDNQNGVQEILNKYIK